MTTFALIANASLIAFVSAVIVGMLAWAIRTSAPQPAVRLAANRAVRRQKARPRGYAAPGQLS